jgi:hypothetical protein
MNNSIEKLQEQTIKTLFHNGEIKWYQAGRCRSTETFLPTTTLQIDEDFSAIPDLKALETGCCSEDNHWVLDIMVTRHSHNEVNVITDEGVVVKKRVCTSTYWAIIGPTDGYGKSNDHIFHHASMKYIVNWHREDLKEQRGLKLKRVELTTDNAKGSTRVSTTSS